MGAVPGTRLTLVSPFPVATYSGMLPGTLAGLYEPEEMRIDLRRLTAASGVRLVVAAATGLDPERREIRLADRPPLRYDVASVGIGSVPAGGSVWRKHPEILSIKPMQTFRDRLNARLDEHRARSSIRIAVVGAGAAGVEVTLCLSARLRSEREAKQPTAFHVYDLSLVDAGPRILAGHRDGTVERVERELDGRGVTRSLGRRAVGYEAGTLRFNTGEPLPADVVVWAAGAAPPLVLENFDLPRTEDGFLAVDDTLRTTAGHDVFVVGDTATLVDDPVPKAGVYAVREGPVLWENLQRTLAGRPLKTYRPQRGFLSLLALGDGRAVGEYGGFSFEGRWAWWLKNGIDRKFMEKHRNFRPMTVEMTADRRPSPRAGAAPAMRCRGCGGKVGASVLDEALGRIELPQPIEHDDGAVLDGAATTVDLATVDAFHAFDDDAYLVGRVAALNALGDIWAMGGRPTGALAVVTLPEGPRQQQAELLYQTLSGSVREFEAHGVRLLGGHTREGSEFAVGSTVLGQLNGGLPFQNANLRPDDRLVLTKPLGTGTLLAAHVQAGCRAAWYETMLDSMLVPNAEAARLAREQGVVAATDVTGFGLVGHLVEMLDASKTSATLELDTIPLLPGFAESHAAGHRSSLDPANREVESRVDRTDALAASPTFAALFDPQTSGGLLLAVPSERVDELVTSLRGVGLDRVAVVGTVVEAGGSPGRIALR